jgi:hypothetical protein
LRSLELSLDKYDSDKINHGYLKEYDPIFEPYVQKKIALLELGVENGGSLLLWRDYFPLGTIAGIDIKLQKPRFNNALKSFALAIYLRSAEECFIYCRVIVRSSQS